MLYWRSLFLPQNAIIVPMRTLKFGSFTNIKSVISSSKKQTLIVVLIHAYNVKRVSKTLRRRKHIFVHPKMFYY